MLINFTMFTESVLDHSKPHTIRRFAKRAPPAIGQPLQLYQNARRPYCQLLLEVPCIHVQRVHIVHGYGVTLGGVDLTAEQLRRLIYADGFRSGAFRPDPAAFWEFFTPGLGVGEAYEGYLVSWAPHTLIHLGPAPDTLPVWTPRKWTPPASRRRAPVAMGAGVGGE